MALCVSGREVTPPSPAPPPEPACSAPAYADVIDAFEGQGSASSSMSEQFALSSASAPGAEQPVRELIVTGCILDGEVTDSSEDTFFED